MYQVTLVGLITSVILERPTCLICISDKVGASRLETLRGVEYIMKTVAVTTRYAGERCRACGSTLGPIYSVPASGVISGTRRPCGGSSDRPFGAGGREPPAPRRAAARSRRR